MAQRGLPRGPQSVGPVGVAIAKGKAMRFLALVPLLLCSSCGAAADTVRVVKVHDGDTVHCLQGIDAPELGQAAAIMLVHLG